MLDKNATYVFRQKPFDSCVKKKVIIFYKAIDVINVNLKKQWPYN